MGGRTHATLKSLELLGGLDVCGSAGSLETGQGGSLEAHVGADTLKVSATRHSEAHKQNDELRGNKRENVLGRAARSRGSGRRAAEDARVDRDRVGRERRGGDDEEGGDLGEHLALGGIGLSTGDDECDGEQRRLRGQFIYPFFAYC